MMELNHKSPGRQGLQVNPHWTSSPSKRRGRAAEPGQGDPGGEISPSSVTGILAANLRDLWMTGVFLKQPVPDWAGQGGGETL